MKRIKVIIGTCIIIFSLFAIACVNTSTKEVSKTETTKKNSTRTLSERFKKYWYDGTAEITSYKLEQAQYGELREGTMVMVFVTEDFNPKKQVKADEQRANNISVLKLNATKNFNTGIYPYSIMNSVFYPLNEKKHAIKLSSSVQEWCGHVYTQLNNRDQFEITSHSYFETESDQQFYLEKTHLESEIWTQLRVDPTKLPTGNFTMIPSLEFSRLRHQNIKASEATGTIKNGQYIIEYPALERTITIDFNPKFPFEIEGWSETYKSGFGPDAKLMTSTVTKMKTIKSAYWGKNDNSDIHLRDSLMLR